MHISWTKNGHWSIMHRHYFRLFKIRISRTTGIYGFQMPFVNESTMLHNSFLFRLFQSKLSKFMCVFVILLQTSPALHTFVRSFVHDNCKENTIQAKVCCLTKEEKNAVEMRQRWKKVITCLDCQSRCFLERSLLFVRNQLHTKNTYTHTHSISHSFFFLFSSIFLNFMCVSRFFFSFIVISFSFFSALMVLACIVHSYTIHVVYECMHAYKRIADTMHEHMHVAPHSLINFQQIHNIIVVDDRALTQQ